MTYRKRPSEQETTEIRRHLARVARIQQQAESEGRPEAWTTTHVTSENERHAKIMAIIADSVE